MKNLYLDIIARIRSKITEAVLPHIDIWNNQIEQMEAQELYTFPVPAVFIELVNTQDVQQLGKGLQIYNDLTIIFHVVHQQLDAGDGFQDRNDEVFDLKQTLYAALDNFEPDGAGMFARQSETEDKSHTNIYHFLQQYKTNFVDISRQKPIGGVFTTPPTDLEINPVTVVDEII